MAAMDRAIPLPTLLSFALVAFTIEFDNLAELRLPHSTTRGGATAGAPHAPWLVSMAMYFNCMRYVADEGIKLRELQRLARTSTNIDGMQRWGYILAVPHLEQPLPRRTRVKPRPDWFVLPRAGGRAARQVWEGLFEVIESRWQDRFGQAAVAALRKCLCELVTQLDPRLPDCMPILGYGLTAKALSGTAPEDFVREQIMERSAVAELPLPALLARVLVAFAVEFESESEVSLAICANVLRVAGQPLLIRDLPRLSGGSKEAMAMATGFLGRHGYATIAAECPASRNKALRLTAKGDTARQTYLDLLPTLESRWKDRFGSEAIYRLHRSLEQLISESDDGLLPLMRGLETQPGNWRHKLLKPETLPHSPLVLHRGGFPDGS